MKAKFNPCVLKGTAKAPPSKSMAHRYLIGAALSGERCLISEIDYSEDILASIDCLKALGAQVSAEGNKVSFIPGSFMKAENPVLNCRESGSTLRFFIPLCLCSGKRTVLKGSERLFERPLDVYEKICSENGFEFEKNEASITICGKLKSGKYTVRGDISSQFITGLIFALVYLGGESEIEIIPPFESRSYVDLTISALESFGARVSFDDEYHIRIEKSQMHSFNGAVEGDYSNAAFLDAFNFIGSDIRLEGLNPESRQGDRVYGEYFKKIASSTPVLDISDCPDLGPVLFALAALKNGARFTGTDRLKVKESDRGAAMHAELSKLGGGLIFGDNEITVPKQSLKASKACLHGHNDHRIVMAMSMILTVTGGEIDDAQAVRKSFPGYFEIIKQLGAEVETQ